jgi:hypothetical protein
LGTVCCPSARAKDRDHPLGCHHRRRIPERVVFEKLLQVLVYGCAYGRIADEQCSASTLRRRRDEWIELGAMDVLEEIVKETYDRTIGLELSDIAVDCCITKPPCGGQRSSRSPVDRGKRGIKRSVAVDADGIPLGTVAAPANRHDSPLLPETLDRVEEILGALPESASVHLDRGYDSDLTRKRLAERDLTGVISEKGKPSPLGITNRWVERTNSWRNAHKKLVVYRAAKQGYRLLLDRLLERDHHRGEARPKSLEWLPLAKPSFSWTMITYWRSPLISP